MTTTIGRIARGVAVAGILSTLAASQTPLHAATATANLSVTATVTAKCTISAPDTLAFDAYDPVEDNVATDLDSSADLTVACTKNAPGVWVGLGNGAHGTRSMSNGGTGALQYQLYSDSNRTTVWGNTAGTGVVYSPSSKDPFDLKVYGRVPAGQDAEAGSYSDTVLATINF